MTTAMRNSGAISDRQFTNSISSDENSPLEVKPKPRAPVLPPCRICGEKASGLHYGVNSCEACKGFFRRSLFNKDKYFCSKASQCEIVPGKRNQCAYCRYQKCLSFGMSVNAIRTGRYTHQKKANDIREVKTLQSSQNESASEETVQATIKAVHAGVANTEVVELVSAHHNDLEESFAENSKLKDDKKLSDEAFGLQRLTHEQHQSFFKTTGIDLDDRRHVIELWSYGSRRRLFLVIMLAKALPGFTDLPLSDQIALIKACRAEAITILYNNRFDAAKRVYYETHCTNIISWDEFIQVYDDVELVEQLFTCARSFQLLQLTVTELLITVGIIITFPDRVVLEAPEKVEAIQSQLVNALQFCIKKNHPNERGLLAKVLGSLVPIRELTIRSNKALPKIHKDWVPANSVDPFWGEFIADSHTWHSSHI